MQSVFMLLQHSDFQLRPETFPRYWEVVRCQKELQSDIIWDTPVVSRQNRPIIILFKRFRPIRLCERDKLAIFTHTDNFGCDDVVLLGFDALETRTNVAENVLLIFRNLALKMETVFLRNIGVSFTCLYGCKAQNNIVILSAVKTLTLNLVLKPCSWKV
jgi:hypothetical protein